MRISIKNSAGEVVLCRGEDSNEFPADYATHSAEQIQQAEGLRWPAAGVIGRLNFKTDVPFTVTREHADHQVACAFATDLIASIQAIALAGAYTVTFVYEQSGAEITRLLSDARLASFDCTPFGCTTVSNFDLKGGVFGGAL
jgi:hypothetical protein